ncbi:MAG: RNA polymerase sigma-70 factor [Tannerellaceae bacterium]|jgi:RNA polymerase sigma-70 factor (ECF subfamily)|nr:RNA polymerase sigma-70 factor [Tannerellaceae bacterium]
MPKHFILYICICVIAITTIFSQTDLRKDNHTDEQGLIYDLKRGSYQAFNEIYRLYAKRLYVYCLSFTKSPEEAEEIVQDVFVKIWINRASIRQDETLRSLFFIMAKHQLINAYRAKLNHPMYEEFVNCKEESSPPDVHRKLEYEEFLRRFRSALEKLPPTQQNVIRLSKMEDMSNKEIAGELRLSEQTVKNQLSLGLKTLKEILNKTAFVWLMICI